MARLDAPARQETDACLWRFDDHYAKRAPRHVDRSAANAVGLFGRSPWWAIRIVGYRGDPRLRGDFCLGRGPDSEIADPTPGAICTELTVPTGATGRSRSVL